MDAVAIDVTDTAFKQAIDLIDAGDAVKLADWLNANSRLLTETVPVAENNAGAYFANPKLLWFVAENPIRNNSLPPNIADIANTIIVAALQHGATDLKEDPRLYSEPGCFWLRCA